jgi:molecular chaperone HtpG
MVRQFADKHAFLRELAQNGIDAGASKIDVVFDRDDTGVVRTSVTDDGAGMSRAIIEGPLLTLFSSSKEGDRAKIGKYGIGFVSVFALEPDVVEVRTTTPGEAWLLRLFGDHTWELAEDKSGAPRGTTVTLVQPMTVEAFTAHVAAGTAALHKWCRHARVPIELVVLDAGDPSATKKISIGQPFTAPGLVSVIWHEGEERIVASVGEAPNEPPAFLGYYNRGLTLFETDRPGSDELDGVRVKIDSPNLSHTLSRDGIVRDRQQGRLVALATDLVTSRLWTELVQALTAAALEAKSADAYLGLLRATTAAAFASERSDEQIALPIVDPIGAQRTMPFSVVRHLSRGEVLFAPEASAITRALAANGIPVVRWLECMPFLRSPHNDEWQLSEVERTIAYSAPDSHRHTGDEALEAALLRLLHKIDLSADHVQMSCFAGAGAAMPYRVTNGREVAIHVEKVTKPRWGRSAIVHLNVEDAGVRLARRRARTEPVVAAHLLLRALLVADGPLSAKVVDRLLEAALE